MDFAFSFFERYGHRQQGKFDREVRQPGILLAWLARQHLLPPAGTTVLVTGSKGKGSVARLTAWGLARHGAGPVGLLVSPEELSHLDRIRVDNQPIPPAVFDDIVDRIGPEIEQLQRSAPPNFYMPPTAVFLAVALCWWREQGVKACVIEGGRGVRFDEIGGIPARVGIVTGVLPEHLNKLGPTIDDIGRDKFSLALNVEELIYPADVQAQAERYLPRAHRARLQAVPTPAAPEAGWYPSAHALATQACRTLVGREVDLPAWPVPSFFCSAVRQTPDGRACDCDVVLDGAVLPTCLEPRLSLARFRQPMAFVLGIADDKDAAGLLGFIQSLDAGAVFAVGLHSEIGHIRSDWLVAGSSALTTIGDLDVVRGASGQLHRAVSDLLCERNTIIFVGVQTFLRSMRNLLAIPLAQPLVEPPAVDRQAGD
jgi:hypothetical protein